MSILKILMISSALAASSTAFASTSHLSDAQYLAAARCQGLMSSPALGKDDTSSIDALMKSESASRIPAVYDRADEMRSDAKREASHAGPQGRADLTAERDRSCQAWANGGPATASNTRMSKTSN